MKCAQCDQTLYLGRCRCLCRRPPDAGRGVSAQTGRRPKSALPVPGPSSPAKSTEQPTKPTELGQIPEYELLLGPVATAERHGHLSWEFQVDAVAAALARIAELEAELDTLKVQRAEYRQRAEQAEAQVAAAMSA